MNQPSTEQAIRDNEQLAELEAMYEQTERALVLIGDRMREIKNRLQKKPPIGGEVGAGNRYLVGETPMPQEAIRNARFFSIEQRTPDGNLLTYNFGPSTHHENGCEYHAVAEYFVDNSVSGFSKLAGGKYEK